MLLNALASLGHKGIKTLRTFGRAGLMLFNALVGKPEFRKHAPLLVRQVIMKPLNLWVQRNNFRRTDACLNV